MSWMSERNRVLFLRLLSPRASDRILDVGAGSGDVGAAVYAESKCEVHALDPDPRKIRSVQKNHPELKACLSESDSMPFPDGHFDKVYTTLALHHFPDQRRSVGEMARVLKHGGSLVIVDISPHSVSGRLARFFENGILRRHLKFLEAAEVSELLMRDGRFYVGETVQDSSGYFLVANRAQN